jgi:hypothetical protein
LVFGGLVLPVDIPHGHSVGLAFRGNELFLQPRRGAINMKVELAASDKAQAGLWMIRQAILQLLREKGPMQPSQIRDALGLQFPESEPPGLAMALVALMCDAGELEKGEGLHPVYRVRASTR